MVTKLMTLYLGFETGGRPACTCVKVVGNLRDARVSARGRFLEPLAPFPTWLLARMSADYCYSRSDQTSIPMGFGANPSTFVAVGATCLCRFHPSGWLRASALTCRLISLVGVKWSCLRINKQAFPFVAKTTSHPE